jgi:hypothetical protein
MKLLADIAQGNSGTADTLFLVAAIVAGVAFLLALAGDMTPPHPVSRFAAALAYAAVCIIAIAWLVL